MKHTKLFAYLYRATACFSVRLVNWSLILVYFRLKFKYIYSHFRYTGLIYHYSCNFFVIAHSIQDTLQYIMFHLEISYTKLGVQKLIILPNYSGI